MNMAKLYLVVVCLLLLNPGEASQEVCLVGEGRSTGSVGPCETNGGCQKYCQEFAGMKVIDAQCVPNRSGKSQCFCVLTCIEAWVDGDPTYESFDRTQIGYQGLCKHLLVQPKRPMDSIPKFAILLTNNRLDQRSVAYPDIVEVIVPSWDFKIVMKDGKCKINEGEVHLPYRFSKIRDGHNEDFVDVDQHDGGLRLNTSFGVSIVKESHMVYIRIPGHRELFNNTAGFLGTWNANPSDDGVDAAGMARDLRKPLDRWRYGNTWCVNPVDAGSYSEEIYDIQIRSQRLEECGMNSARVRFIQGCRNLENSETLKCFGEQLEDVIKSCITDVCCTQNKEEEAICDAKSVISQHCSLDMKCP